MDLFVLDKLVMLLVKKIMSDGVLQFSILVALWLVSEIALPNKKIKEKNK